jgi:hypothetical protein
LVFRNSFQNLTVIYFDNLLFYYRSLFYIGMKLGIWLEIEHTLRMSVNRLQERILGSKRDNNFWKELLRVISLYYLSIKYKLRCLTKVNYVPWFPWLHHLPQLMWLNSGSN